MDRSLQVHRNAEQPNKKNPSESHASEGIATSEERWGADITPVEKVYAGLGGRWVLAVLSLFVFLWDVEETSL